MPCISKNLYTYITILGDYIDSIKKEKIISSPVGYFSYSNVNIRSFFSNKDGSFIRDEEKVIGIFIEKIIIFSELYQILEMTGSRTGLEYRNYILAKVLHDNLMNVIPIVLRAVENGNNRKRDYQRDSL